MTELENCMGSLVHVFQRYAAGDGDQATLTQKELKTLLEAELPGFLSCQKSPEIVSEMMKDLDQNNDKKVDFREFVALATALSCACEDMCRHHQDQGKK